MMTRDVDSVVVVEELEKATRLLEAEGFPAERHRRSVNFKGKSSESLQLSTEEVYLTLPERAVAVDVHGILLRFASLEDTLRGKIVA